MKHISAAPPRLYCATCDDTYDLPPKTHIKLYKELKCPLDDFELLSCSTGEFSRFMIGSLSSLVCSYYL